MLLFCLWPLFLVIPLILYVFYGVSPWFRQARVGQFGKVFVILKFKTMYDADDCKPSTMPLANRTTPLGAFLRKYSLDEIPQLINVIKGDMSLIGPRPLLIEYYHLFDDFQNRRHQVRPGITGLVQVSGRNALPWPKRFYLDAHYVASYNFALDLKILFKTAWVLLFEKQISPTGIPEEPYEV